MQDEDKDFNLSPETVQKAIEAVKGRSWDVNPFTVADELKVSRSVIYRHAEAMKLIIAARGGGFGMDVQTSLDLTWQLRQLEQQNIELMERLALNKPQPLSVAGSETAKEGEASAWANSDEIIVNFAGNEPYIGNYSSQLANMSWKDLETIYYFKVASLKDHAKNLFGNGSKSDGANGEQSSVTESRSEQSITYGSLGSLESGRHEKQSSLSPFAQLKTSKTRIEQFREEALLEPMLKMETKQKHKEEVIESEQIPIVNRIETVPETINLVESNKSTQQLQPESEVQPKPKQTSELEQEQVIDKQQFELDVQPQLVPKEPLQSESKRQIHPEPETLMQKMSEIPMRLASQIRAKLASDASLRKEDKKLSAAESEISTGQKSTGPIPIDGETLDKSEEQLPSEPKTGWRQAFKWQPEAKTEVEPEIEMQQQEQSQIEAKTQELPDIDISLTEKSVLPESAALIASEPKLISLSKEELPAVLQELSHTTISKMEAFIQREVDTGDLAPVESESEKAFDQVEIEDTAPVESKENFDKTKAKEDIAISGDELRDLIQSHIKNAAEQMAENAHPYSIGTGKEFEVWLNNPARSKFIGSPKNQDANANTEENASTNTTNPPGPAAFKPRVVPPEVRKACLILGVRMDNITYEVVQDAWKKAIAAPGVHPDQGGDTELAVYLNTAKDVLMRWLDAQAPKLGKKFGAFKKDKEPQPKKDKKKDQQ